MSTTIDELAEEVSKCRERHELDEISLEVIHQRVVELQVARKIAAAECAKCQVVLETLLNNTAAFAHQPLYTSMVTKANQDLLAAQTSYVKVHQTLEARERDLANAEAAAAASFMKVAKVENELDEVFGTLGSNTTDLFDFDELPTGCPE